MLDATRLRVLVAIARHGSVTAAAQALNYAQPSISHHMARLESDGEFAEQLFVPVSATLAITHLPSTRTILNRSVPQ